jgi:hypothetical protein
VYKAIDDHYYRYENRFWRDTSNVDGLLMFERNVEKNNVVVPGYRLKRLVAIKKIYKNSAPGRILNEIEILQKLRYVFEELLVR